MVILSECQYPYPVNDILEWLGNKVDLIFGMILFHNHIIPSPLPSLFRHYHHHALPLVCFDPHGQALCARTMDVVQKLNASQKSKMHYFLTMADKV